MSKTHKRFLAALLPLLGIVAGSWAQATAAHPATPALGALAAAVLSALAYLNHLGAETRAG